MDLMEILARNPSMRKHLEVYNQQKAEALGNIEEYCNVLGIVCDAEAKENCFDVKTAALHKQACDGCKYTVDDCEECRYARVLRKSKYDEIIPECTKYATLQKNRAIARIMGNSGVGERFNNRRFETFIPSPETQAAYDACRRFCDTYTSNSTGLMLLGSFGCGKTHLAASVIRRMAEKGVPGVFVVVPELLANIRASYGKPENTSEEIIQVAKDAQLLVMDDLGAENATDWVLEQLYLIVNHRYENMMPTIVTTNYRGKELEQHIGRRILSRIAEMTDPIQIKAADYRLRKYA